MLSLTISEVNMQKNKDRSTCFCKTCFDNIWKPQRSLKKFSCHGTEDKGHLWFKNYLKDRKQKVGIHGLFSPQKDTMTRVIQDPVLGPLLFSLFRGDLKNSNYWRDSAYRWFSITQGRQIWSSIWRITGKSHHAWWWGYIKLSVCKCRAMYIWKHSLCTHAVVSSISSYSQGDLP